MNQCLGRLVRSHPFGHVGGAWAMIDRPGSWLPGVNKDIDGSREVWKFVSQYRL